MLVRALCVFILQENSYYILECDRAASDKQKVNQEQFEFLCFAKCVHKCVIVPDDRLRDTSGCPCSCQTLYVTEKFPEIAGVFFYSPLFTTGTV